MTLFGPFDRISNIIVPPRRAEKRTESRTIAGEQTSQSERYSCRCTNNPSAFFPSLKQPLFSHHPSLHTPPFYQNFVKRQDISHDISVFPPSPYLRTSPYLLSRDPATAKIPLPFLQYSSRESRVQTIGTVGMNRDNNGGVELEFPTDLIEISFSLLAKSHTLHHRQRLTRLIVSKQPCR